MRQAISAAKDGSSHEATTSRSLNGEIGAVRNHARKRQVSSATRVKPLEKEEAGKLDRPPALMGRDDQLVGFHRRNSKKDFAPAPNFFNLKCYTNSKFKMTKRR